MSLTNAPISLSDSAIELLVQNNTKLRLANTLSFGHYGDPQNVYALVVAYKMARYKNRNLMSFYSMIHLLLDLFGTGDDIWGHRLDHHTEGKFDICTIHVALGMTLKQEYSDFVPNMTAVNANEIIARLDIVCVERLLIPASVSLRWPFDQILNNPDRRSFIVDRLRDLEWTEERCRSYFSAVYRKDLGSNNRLYNEPGIWMPIETLLRLEPEYHFIALNLWTVKEWTEEDLWSAQGQIDMSLGLDKFSSELMYTFQRSNEHRCVHLEWIAKRIAFLATPESRRMFLGEVDNLIKRGEREGLARIVVSSLIFPRIPSDESLDRSMEALHNVRSILAVHTKSATL